MMGAIGEANQLTSRGGQNISRKGAREMRTLVKLMCVVAVATVAAAQAHAVILTNDTFSYADGQLTNVAAGIWVPFSGVNSPNVTNGQVIISGGRDQDVGLTFGTSGQHTNDVLYYCFDINYSASPSPGTLPSYYSLFKDSSGANLFARTWHTNDGGVVRQGIGNQSTTPPAAGPGFDGLLTLGTTYKIVVRYDQ